MITDLFGNRCCVLPLHFIDRVSVLVPKCQSFECPGRVGLEDLSGAGESEWLGKFLNPLLADKSVVKVVELLDNFLLLSDFVIF